MKHSFLTCLFILLSTIIFAQNDTADVTNIKAVIKHQETAWNKHDWESLVIDNTDDATLINFIGEFWKNKDDIVTHFKQLNDCCLWRTSLKLEVKNIRFLTPGIALVYVEETIVADKDYDTPFHNYKKGDTDYKMATDVFVKQNNEWKVTATQLTLINQTISPHNASEKL